MFDLYLIELFDLERGSFNEQKRIYDTSNERGTICS